MEIDINCDMGEGFGRYSIGNDEALFPFITSANIACGFHAGDPQVMRRTVQLAKEHHVAIGAHPGFYDLVGFGRREMKVGHEQLFADLVYQIGALEAFARIEGVSVRHVKLHGALYNMAHRDRSLAEVVVEAVAAVNPGLLLYTLPGGALREEAIRCGLATAAEFFADRTYQDDGSLTQRQHPQAMVHDPAQAAARVIRMLREGVVESVNGTVIPMKAETVCIHGDEQTAVAFAREIRSRLDQEGIVVRAIERA